MSEAEELRAEVLRLRELLEVRDRDNDLFLIGLVFLAAIALSILIFFWGQLAQIWKEYKYLIEPLNPTASDVDRRIRLHDYFNLLVLPGLIVLDVYFLSHGAVGVYHNPRFWRFFWYSVIYIVIDLLWVAAVPSCVKSPPTILVHHCLTLLYLGIPAYNPDTRYMMAVDLMVELNTWLLIMRRQPISRKGSVKPVVSCGFYITWFVIRCMVYPYGIYEVYCLFARHVEKLAQEENSAWQRARWGLTYMFIPVVFQTLLVLLNIHWTIQLLRNATKRKGPSKGL